MSIDMKDIVIKRANGEYERYISNIESLDHNTSFVAISSDKNIVAIADFIIKDCFEAVVDFTSFFEFKDVTPLLKAFLEEFLYWNPFIKKIKLFNPSKEVDIKAIVENSFVSSHCEENVYTKEIEPSVELFRIDINSIQPSQLTVNINKLERLSKWIKKEADIIIPVIKIKDNIVAIDGHTRLLRAHQLGFQYLYAYYETESYDEQLYNTFVSWCYDNSIYRIRDLETKIVSEKEHEQLWVARCQNYIRNRS